MIQRKQTLFLLLTAILCSLTLFFPLATIESIAPQGAVAISGTPDTATYDVWGIHYSSAPSLSIYYHGILAILAVALPVLTIFLYRKRSLQLAFCFAEGILVVGLLIFEGIGIYKLSGVPNYTIDHSIFVIAPLFALATIFLAYKGILRDILLLRSVDRIR